MTSPVFWSMRCVCVCCPHRIILMIRLAALGWKAVVFRFQFRSRSLMALTDPEGRSLASPSVMARSRSWRAGSEMGSM